MKKTLLTTALIIALAAGFAYAHGGWGRGSHNGYGMMGTGMMGGGNGMMGKGFRGGANNWDCPGRTSAAGSDWWGSDQQQTFLDETATLRKQLNDKRFEFMEAKRNPETTAEQLGTLEKELIDLRTQISTKARQYRGTVQ